MAALTMRRATASLAALLALALPAVAPAQVAGPPAGPPAEGPASAAADTAAAAAGRELVVVVHGMGRTARSMRPLAAALEAEGFTVLNFGYSSTCCGIAELGTRLRAAVDSAAGPDVRAVHFVGHSLGGILIRWVLTRDEPPARVGRVVLLAPPNQGSRAADRFAPVIEWLLEPIDELRTDSTSTVRRLPAVRGVPIGVIAGGRDGKVRVADTHLPEEADHVVVDGAHTFLMRRDDVQRLTAVFLRQGSFGEAVRADPVR